MVSGLHTQASGDLVDCTVCARAAVRGLCAVCARTAMPVVKRPLGDARTPPAKRHIDKEENDGEGWEVEGARGKGI